MRSAHLLGLLSCLWCCAGCAKSSQPQAAAAGAGGGTAMADGSAGAADTGQVSSGGAASFPLAPATRQLVTVITENWIAVPAALQRFELAESGEWAAVGQPVAVVVGKSGLGWGRGIVPVPQDGGPIKKEGDGRSPAGIFALSSVFGYAPPDQATWVQLPYVQATDDLECVDDPASIHYNQLVKKSGVASVDWNSSEIMKRGDTQYRWGVFVDHNTAPTAPGAGSCIFLHLWSGPTSSTVGCTAGEETKMKEVFGWLDPKKHPLLVQLPRATYDAQRVAWALP